MSFLSGVTGAFSQALSITMAAALAISYLMTAFVVPVLARHLVDFDRWRDPGAAGDGWLARGHGRLLDSLFARPWLFGFALVPLLAVGWFAYSAVPTGFMPAVDEGGFILDYYTPPGTSLTETSREVGADRRHARRHTRRSQRSPAVSAPVSAATWAKATTATTSSG